MINPTTSRFWCLLLLGIMYSPVGLNRASAQQVPPLQQRFLAEAPAAWAKYREFDSSVVGTSSTEFREKGPQDDRFEWTNRFQSKRWKGWRLDESDRHETQHQKGEVFRRYTGNVYGRNSRYSFELTRKSSNDSWVISKITDLRNGQSDDHEDDEKARICLGLSLQGRRAYFPDLLKSPHLQLVDVSPETLDGANLIKLTFTYAPPKNQVLRGGKVLLDPDHDWVVRKGELDLASSNGSNSKKRFELEYKEGPERHPIITAVGVWSAGKDEKGNTVEWERESKMDLHVAEPLPESAFTVSAYGLPEPFGMEAPRPRWYLWGAGAGLVCLIAGVWLRHRLQRAA